jgi:hypothetical protein
MNSHKKGKNLQGPSGVIIILLVILCISIIWAIYWGWNKYKNPAGGIETFAADQPGYKWSITKSKDTNKYLMADISNLTPSRHVPSLINKTNSIGTTELQPATDNVNITLDDQTVKLIFNNEVVRLNPTVADNQEYLSFLAPTNPDDAQDYKFFETPNRGDAFTVAMWVKFPGPRNLAEQQSENLFEIYNPDKTGFYIARRANNYQTEVLGKDAVINKIELGFNDNTKFVSNASIIDNNWHHICVVVKYSYAANPGSDTIHVFNTGLYIDGKLDNNSDSVSIRIVGLNPNTAKPGNKAMLAITPQTQINIGKNSNALIITKNRKGTIISTKPTTIYSKIDFTDLQMYPVALDEQSVKGIILKSRFAQTVFIPGQTKTLLGNLIKFSTTAGELKRPLPETTGRNVIQLQSPSKITGFKFVSKNGTERYRLFIADSIQQLLNPRTRIEIRISEAEAAGGFNMSADPAKSLYNNKPDFEKEDGTPRYTGSVLAIEMPTGITTWPEIIEYQIFGQLLNAPSMAEYEKYNNLVANISFAKSSAQTPSTNDVIRVALDKDADQMIGKLVLSNFRATPGYSPQCRMKFRNSLDTSKTSLFAVNGPIRDQFINTPDTREWTIYLDRPIMANYLELTFTDSNNTPLNITDTNLTLFGMTPSTRDVANYKLQAGQTTSDARMNIGGMNCPSTSEMLNKQVQAQLVCEALEYKDKEKNKRLAYERDKLYLLKLKAQEEEIHELEKKINGLIARKKELASKSQGTNIEIIEKELKAATESRQRAEDYLKAKDAQREALKLKFNLEPHFQEILTSIPTPTA